MTAQVVNPERTQMAEPLNSSPPHNEEEEEAVKANEEKNEEEHNVDSQEQKIANPSPNKVVEKCSSLRGESNFHSDLKDSEKKALAELKAKIEEAIAENKLFKKEDPKPQENQEPKQEEEAKKEEPKKPEENQEPNAEEKAKEEEEVEDKPEADGNSRAEEAQDTEISLWGVPLVPGKNSDATDVILLKFLRGREFKVNESFEMLKNTLQWRKDSKIDSILDETELGKDFVAASYMEGLDREGHPVCYNVPAVLQKEEVYKEVFGSKEGRERFLRWRVQVMEKGIQKLDLRPAGVSRLLQVTDLKDSVGPSKKELRDTMKRALQVLQDNYPEFVARNVSLLSFYFLSSS